ncbi:MAG: glycosyltransferase family protein [Alphaproteobacteria bacterium]
MKIVYIAPQAIPSRAANSIHVMKMMQTFGKLGHDAVLYFQKSGGRTGEIFSTYGVEPVFTLAPKIKLPAPFNTLAYPLHNAVSAFFAGPDLVLSRNLLTAWLTAHMGLKTIFEIHDSPDALQPVALKVFRSFAAHKNSSLIVISQALNTHLQNNHKIPADKIILAPDAADPLPPLENPPFGTPPGSFHAGYAGHLYKGRGIDRIGEMAAALPAITFHIIGGTNEDIAWWKHKLAGLNNILFRGHLAHARIGDYLQCCDVLLAPYQENVSVTGNKGDTGRWMSPLKIFEYMAAGKPILCSDLPVLREILNDNNSILLPHNDAEPWITALSMLKKNPGKASSLGQAAQKDFLESCTWLKRAENILNRARHHG